MKFPNVNVVLTGVLLPQISIHNVEFNSKMLISRFANSPEKRKHEMLIIAESQKDSKRKYTFQLTEGVRFVFNMYKKVRQIQRTFWEIGGFGDA